MPIVDFRSDNTGAAAPQIIEAIAAANTGTAAGYGADDWTARLQQRFSDLFETKVRVFPVATGTAANALALASICPPFGAVYCSPIAHIETSEGNATGFFGSGTKLVHVDGPHGKMDPARLSDLLGAAGVGLTHKSQPAAINLTQATDLGAVYRLDEIRALTAIARAHGLKVHMDGARFANAVARLGCSPAEATWRAGVDILSFGMTKNGGLMADAIVVFSDKVAQQLAFHLRRAGQVWSKMRFASAQLIRYVEDGLWLDLAGRSNAAAARIAKALEAETGVRLLAPVEANEIFVEMTPAAMDALEKDGIRFFRRGPRMARFVCRWDTTDAEIRALTGAIARGSVATAK
ncbi:MAG TPA: beta-eliminating lyase-related protein [Alphaproteobacteria bacterium]|nr:beta-eliminating lyase-related protein [Alphaproteobacteria bacterium]